MRGLTERVPWADAGVFKAHHKTLQVRSGSKLYSQASYKPGYGQSSHRAGRGFEL